MIYDNDQSKCNIFRLFVTYPIILLVDTGPKFEIQKTKWNRDKKQFIELPKTKKIQKGKILALFTLLIVIAILSISLS